MLQIHWRHENGKFFNFTKHRSKLANNKADKSGTLYHSSNVYHKSRPVSEDLVVFSVTKSTNKSLQTYVGNYMLSYIVKTVQL